MTKNINNLKQYFEYEKDKNYNLNSDLNLENNFKRLLNNLELKEPIDIGSNIVQRESFVSVYVKYLALLSAPLALAMFSFFFLDLYKIQDKNENQNQLASDNTNLAITVDESVMSEAMMSRAAIVSQDLPINDIESYKQELYSILLEADTFSEISETEI